MKRRALLFLAAGLAIGATTANSAPIIDQFNVSIDVAGQLEGGGTGFNNGAWYFYPDTGWWNQWFYDHPFDPDRWKEIHLEFDVVALDPGVAAELDLAVNWSTPAWDDVPGNDDSPPIPGFPGFDEGLHIVREIIPGDDPGNTIQHFSFDISILDYNPEWISIDVRGFNFEIINGIIEHECIPTPGPLMLLAMGALVATGRRR